MILLVKVKVLKTMRIVRLIAFLGILAPSSLAGQHSLPADQSNPSQAGPVATGGSSDIPKFKSRTELVLVPVVVRDKQGQHVSGLSKDDFRLEENGKEQSIVSFEEMRAEKMDVPVARADSGYSNLPLDSSKHLRVTIVVLDLLNSRMLQRTEARDQLIKFFSKELLGEEPVSLLCITSKGVRLVLPFTSDTNLLIKALRETKLEDTWLGTPGDSLRETLKQVRQIGQAYVGVPGRKTLLWATGDIPYPATAQDYDGAGMQMRLDLEDTERSLQSANVGVYPVSVLAWSVADPSSLPRIVRNETLRSFADQTGGKICMESNGFRDCLNAAIGDSRSYYMLSYTLKPEDRKPGWRSLKVKLIAKQADVRARSGFYYGDREVSDKPRKPHEDEINALASPLASSGVRMNVRVLLQRTPSPASAGGKTTAQFLLIIPLDSVTIDPTRDAALDLEVGAIALDKNMKEAGEFLHPVRGNPKPEILRQFAQEGIRLQEKLDLLPGAYDVRFVVRDNATGQIGTVVFPFEMK